MLLKTKLFNILPEAGALVSTDASASFFFLTDRLVKVIYPQFTKANFPTSVIDVSSYSEDFFVIVSNYADILTAIDSFAIDAHHSATIIIEYAFDNQTHKIVTVKAEDGIETKKYRLIPHSEFDQASTAIHILQSFNSSLGIQVPLVIEAPYKVATDFYVGKLYAEFALYDGSTQYIPTTYTLADPKLLPTSTYSVLAQYFFDVTEATLLDSAKTYLKITGQETVYFEYNATTASAMLEHLHSRFNCQYIEAAMLTAETLYIDLEYFTQQNVSLNVEDVQDTLDERSPKLYYALTQQLSAYLQDAAMTYSEFYGNQALLNNNSQFAELKPLLPFYPFTETEFENFGKLIAEELQYIIPTEQGALFDWLIYVANEADSASIDIPAYFADYLAGPLTITSIVQAEAENAFNLSSFYIWLDIATLISIIEKLQFVLDNDYPYKIDNASIQRIVNALNALLIAKESGNTQPVLNLSMYGTLVELESDVLYFITSLLLLQKNTDVIINSPIIS